MKTSSGDEPSIDCRPSARASGNLHPGGGGAVAFEPAAANDERIVLDGDQPVNGIERDDGYLISPSQGRAPHPVALRDGSEPLRTAAGHRRRGHHHSNGSPSH